MDIKAHLDTGGEGKVIVRVIKPVTNHFTYRAIPSG
jgi:hypothetical protein